MRKFDQSEKIILRELIRNPRISDNAIGKKTKIPVKSVNNKRKKMEKEGFLHYYTYVNQGPDGTKTFNARYQYQITFREGIARKNILDLFKNEAYHPLFFKHLMQTMIAEKDGHVIIISIIESRVQEDMVEIFNAEIVPFFHHHFGKEAIKSVEAMPIYTVLRYHHNYLTFGNLENGKIKDDWKDDWIFVE